MKPALQEAQPQAKGEPVGSSTGEAEGWGLLGRHSAKSVFTHTGFFPLFVTDVPFQWCPGWLCSAATLTMPEWPSS